MINSGTINNSKQPIFNFEQYVVRDIIFVRFPKELADWVHIRVTQIILW